MKPDQADLKILRALMVDGRASFSEIARKTSLTTPTVSAHVARMAKAGLIKRFVPVISGDSVDRGVLFLVLLRADADSQERVAKGLAKLPEVEEVFLTSDQGVALKVSLEGVRELQPFLRRIAHGRPRVTVASSQVVTSVVKEEPPSRLPRALDMKLRCDYCQGEVLSNRPYTVVAGPSRYYFCCKTCKRSYLDKYGPKLARLKGAA